MSEADLVRRFQAGDEEVFRLLVEPYRDLLLGTAYLMTGDRSLAEDLVQEALVQVWRGLWRFQPRGSFKAWLVKILVNRVKQHRRRKWVPTVPLEEVAGIFARDTEVEEIVFESEVRRLLKGAMDTLPDVQRQLIVLRYYSGLSVPEIAQVLGCREGTVKSRLHRALGRLASVLDMYRSQRDPG